ncbi:peptide/nickel transport system permease protein [Rhodococcus sp. 27YEA15]
MASLLFLVFVTMAAVLGPMLVPHDPNTQDLSNTLQGPTGAHWLGTDDYGRDVLSRLVSSAGVTLLAVVEAVGIAAAIGIPLGLFSGLVGGWVGAFLSRVSDAIQSLPSLIFAIAVVAVLGISLTNAMLAIGIVLAPSLFRLARGAAESVATETYIEACRAIGCSNWRLLWRHVLPNASSPLLVQVSFSAGVAIVAEASLSFLGIGVQPPNSSWGSMVRSSFDTIYAAPGQLMAPSIMIVLTVLAFSTLGDGLRDSLETTGTTKSLKLFSKKK